MSMAIAHFAFGAGMTALVIAFLLPRVEFPRMLILFGGGWAMLPDVNKLYDSATLDAIHSHQIVDIFWLHWTFDTHIDPNDSWTIAAILFAFFIASMVIYEYRVTLDRGPVAHVVPERLIGACRPLSLAGYFGEAATEESES